MDRFLRQLIFVLFALFLQWPLYLLIFLVGRTGMLKTLFLIYPIDREECLDFSPDISWLRRFFSARPTPAGLIMNGWLPVGIYLVVPDTAMDLVRRKNRQMVEKIIHRMLWFQRLSRARAIGLAGQLGPIFEKQLGTAMKPPFYTSTYGNIFSIQSGLNYLVAESKRKPWQLSLAILGGGELGEQLQASLATEGYRVELVEVRYTRKGGVRLVDEQQAESQLEKAAYVVNLLPRGKDFLDCGLNRRIRESAAIVDFSRPPLDPETISQRVVMGNRVQSGNISFFVNLPGGWKRHELPACSMPSILASLGAVSFDNMEQFRLAARQMAFSTALSGAVAAAAGDGKTAVVAGRPVTGEI